MCYDVLVFSKHMVIGILIPPTT